MSKHHPRNERIKRSYRMYLKEAKGFSEASLDAVAKAIHRFESHTRCRDFATFHIEQAVAFKRHLSEQRGARGQLLSKATVHATLNHLRAFFSWLAGQPGYKSRLRYSDADYFRVPMKDARVATARRAARTPTLEQIRHVIRLMPSGTDVERRDRALIAFTLLTGARDSAIASMCLRHVDLVERSVFQDARQVNTKNSKTFTSRFFPVGGDIEAIVVEWIAYLQMTKLWGLDDPLFPSTLRAQDEHRRFQAVGLERLGWRSAGPIRRIFREAFTRAGLPYFNPHSFRKTLVRLGETVCRTPEEFKAWSQNLGHEGVLTTFCSYGTVGEERQGQIMRALHASSAFEGSRPNTSSP